MTFAPTRSRTRPALGARAILDGLGTLPAPSQSPVLVLLAGLPGSGKSTLARRLAPAIGAAVLESDRLRRLFFVNPDHGPGENARLFGAIYAASMRLLHAGVSVILDATNLKASDRSPAINLARSLGVRLCVVYVEAPVAVIEERLRARERQAGVRSRGLQRTPPVDSSDAGIEVFRRMALTAEPPAEADCWRVDTGDAAACASAVNQLIVALTTLAPEGNAGPGPKGGTMGGRP